MRDKLTARQGRDIEMMYLAESEQYGTEQPQAARPTAAHPRSDADMQASLRQYNKAVAKIRAKEKVKDSDGD